MTEYFCTICEKGIGEEPILIDAKRRHYHTRCLKAALAEFDKWGIEMLRQFASTINLRIGAQL